jgi:hypothetical protein
MTIPEIPYKSYCWAIGTTSYRTENFNLSIERQLQLMEKFRDLPENKGVAWLNLQVGYYNYLKDNEFVKGEATRPDKDAREKTSGLVDIGLMDSERNITEAGKAILKLSKDENYGKDNELQISNDSFIYLKQLLKTSKNIDGNYVRPFIVSLYVFSKLEYLTNDEFTYLLPLCINKQRTDEIITNIKEYRNDGMILDSVLISVINSMDNYKKAYEVFCQNKISEKLLCATGMNRKSRDYDKPYYPFYKVLKKVVLGKADDNVFALFEAVEKISGKTSLMWKKYLFNTSSKKAIQKGNLNVVSVKLLEGK